MKKISNIFFTLIIFFAVSSNLAAQSLEWAKNFGSLNDDRAQASAIDASGNTFVLSSVLGAVAFNPANLSAFSTSNFGNSRYIALSKFNSIGKLQWVKSFGSSIISDYGYCVTTDNLGNVYFAGSFGDKLDIDPSPTDSNFLYVQAYSDAFIIKLDKDGKLIWGKQLSGNQNEDIKSIAVDEQYNIYVTGEFSGNIDCDSNNPGAHVLTTTRAADIFVAKYDVSGNYIFAKSISGPSDKYCYSIKTDNAHNIYLASYFRNTVDANPGAGTDSIKSNGLMDILLTKLDASGNYLWSRHVGGSGDDIATSIDVNPITGSIYLVGSFSTTVDFNPALPGTSVLTSSSVTDFFLLKYDTNGNFKYVKKWGGKGQDNAQNVALDGLGNLFITGYISNTVDFNPGGTSFPLTSVGNFDAFILKTDTIGNFHWAKRLGGFGNDWGMAVNPDGAGNVFAIGTFSFTADMGDNGIVLTSVDGYDIYMFKSALTTDITETKSFPDVRLYPNPTTGMALIDLKTEYSQITVKVRTVLGSEFLNTRFNNVSNVKINLPSESGVYFVDLIDSNGKSTTFKVLKK